MPRILADWLKNDYVMEKGEVRPKTNYVYEVNGEEYELPAEAVWIQTFSQKDKPDLIIRCVPTIKHSHCLVLADKFKDIVKLNTAKREVHEWPYTNDVLHGYMTIINADGIFADGETHKETLNRTMWPYATTMMYKRAEDRLVLRALGLYQAGFYSSEEFGGEGNATTEDIEKVVDKSSNTIDMKDIKRKAAKSILKDIKALNEDFDPVVFVSTLMNSEDFDSFTAEQWRNIGESADKILNKLREEKAKADSVNEN